MPALPVSAQKLRALTSALSNSCADSSKWRVNCECFQLGTSRAERDVTRAEPLTWVCTSTKKQKPQQENSNDETKTVVDDGWRRRRDGVERQ
jgi:hypothetical protein